MRDWIVGNYVVQRKLGAGPFCEAYLGELPSPKTQIILKRVHPALVAIPKICVRLRAQAITPPKLEHTGIASLITMLLDRDDVWLIGERATGVPFEDTLTAPKEPARVIPAFGRLLEAFDQAHRQGWIHADLKSSNLWVEPTGEFKVLDFATCRLFGYTPATRDLLGVDAYRSPEQVAGEDIDPRSDIYSLGRILQRMLGGVSGPLDAVVRMATAKDKDQRYRGVADFREALLRCLPAPAPSPVVMESPSAAVPEPTPEEPVFAQGHEESFLERLSRPFRSILSRTSFAANGNAANGHATEPAPPKEAAEPVVVDQPAPAPAASEPARRVPQPEPLLRSLKETLATQLVDFDPGTNGTPDKATNGNGTHVAATPPAPPVRSRRAALLEETIDFEPERFQRAVLPQVESSQPTAPAEPEDPSDYGELLDGGFDAFRKGDFVLAQRLWQRAREMDGSNKVVNYNLRLVERKIAAGNGR